MKTLLVSAVLALTMVASGVAFAAPYHDPERGSTSPERSIAIEGGSHSTQNAFGRTNEPE